MSGKERRAPRLLLIAPIQKAGASVSNVAGGNKVMADEQVRELGARGFEVDVIDTSGDVTNLPAWKIWAHRLARFLRVAWGVARKLGRSDVVFLIIASYSALRLASFLWAVCKIARRPLVLRISGGDIDGWSTWDMARSRVGWPSGPICTLRWCTWRRSICTATSTSGPTSSGSRIREK